MRLANELIQTGWDEEQVEEMSRDRLTEEWANIVAAERETPTESGSPEVLRTTTFHPSEDFERERLAFEQQKYEEKRRGREREGKESKGKRERKSENISLELNSYGWGKSA